MFRPASAIVNEVLLEERVDEHPCPSLPKPENMARAANRLRQQLRPEDPTDLAFDISEENIPAGFLKGDVRSRSKRHLLFATNQQLQQLVLAKNWYVDGTFKLCRQPFTQGAASKPNRFLYCLSSCLVRESRTTVQCCKKC